MKKAIALILALLLALSTFGALAASNSIPINKKNFPDSHFRRLVSGPDYDLNENGKLSRAEIKKIDTVHVVDCNIRDITGVGYFPYVATLEVSGNPLIRLDVSKFTRLATLWAGNTKIVKLDVSQNKKLQEIRCQSCSWLRKLTLGTHKYLDTLDCANNPKLKKLDIGKCSKLLKYVKKGKIIKKNGNVMWAKGNAKNPDYFFLRIPATCTLYSGKKVLYKGK